MRVLMVFLGLFDHQLYVSPDPIRNKPSLDVESSETLISNFPVSNLSNILFLFFQSMRCCNNTLLSNKLLSPVKMCLCLWHLLMALIQNLIAVIKLEILYRERSWGRNIGPQGLLLADSEQVGGPILKKEKELCERK